MTLLRIRYQTLEFDNMDIHIRSLRDRMQFSDDFGVAEKMGISSATWPLFGVVWGAGEALAHLMADYMIEGKRILEVGCGIALASLVLNYRNADITATDHHPEAENFLRENVQLNKGEDIPFVRTDWDDDESGLGLFDLIIGSDLLYERTHAELLSGFIDKHAKPQCEIIIIDPGRGHQSHFNKAMALLGYSHTKEVAEDYEQMAQPFKGSVLHYNR